MNPIIKQKAKQLFENIKNDFFPLTDNKIFNIIYSLIKVDKEHDDELDLNNIINSIKYEIYNCEDEFSSSSTKYSSNYSSFAPLNYSYDDNFNYESIANYIYDFLNNNFEDYYFSRDDILAFFKIFFSYCEKYMGNCYIDSD